MAKGGTGEAVRLVLGQLQAPFQAVKPADGGSRRGPHFGALQCRGCSAQLSLRPPRPPRTLLDFRRDLCLALERRVPFFKETLTAVLPSSSADASKATQKERHRNRRLLRTPEGRLGHHPPCAHRAAEDTCAAYD